MKAKPDLWSCIKLFVVMCMAQFMGVQAGDVIDKENDPACVNRVPHVLGKNRLYPQNDQPRKRVKRNFVGFSEKTIQQLEKMELDPLRVWGFHQILYFGMQDSPTLAAFHVELNEARSFFKDTLKSRYFLREEAINPDFLYTNALIASANRPKRSFVLKCRLLFGEQLKEAERKFFRRPLDDKMIAFKHQERIERQEINWQSGAFCESTDKKILACEEKKWADFFDYFKTRDASKLLTRKEIEEKFEALVARHYDWFYIDETDKAQGIFFYAPETISPQRLDNFRNPSPRTNIERVRDEGLSPIGADYAEMNIHHLTYHQPGVYILLSRSFHRDHHRKLHFSIHHGYIRPKAPDRLVFQRIKQDYIFPQLGELLGSTSPLSQAASEA